MITVFKKYLRWLLSFYYFKSFAKKNLFNDINDNDGTECIILIQPWDFNIVPWFSITFHLILNRNNVPSSILVDDLNLTNKFDIKFQIFAINQILKLFNNSKIEYLSSFYQDLHNDDINYSFIETLAYANAVQYYRGDIFNSSFNNQIELVKTEIYNSLKYIVPYLIINKHKKFYLPGGIFGNSGIFFYLLKKYNSKFITFDSGEQIYMSSINGIASHLDDIEISYKLIKDCNNKTFLIIEQMVLRDIINRKQGTHFLNIQKAPITNNIYNDVGFLIPLNIFWDGAALLIDNFYSNYYQWLMSTIETILENCNDNITIRQHPDERHWWGIALFDFKNEIEKKFNNNLRIKFIDKNQDINTYDLISQSKAIICFSSTIAIESYINGKNVAVGSSCYYSNYNFVNKINCENDLISFIQNTEYIFDAKSYEEAIYLYYLGQLCNWNKTKFTPYFSDFLYWKDLRINEIMNLSGTSTIFKSFIDYLPVSYLNHINYDIDVKD